MPMTVTLPGPAPWGFRITGGRDFGKPITVSKVTEHGKAAAGDLRPGDIIVTINGESAAEMLNVEAQNKIKQSPGQLRLQVERWVLSGGAPTAAEPVVFPSSGSWGSAIPMGACPGSVIKDQAALAAVTRPTGPSWGPGGSAGESQPGGLDSSPGPALPPPPRPPSPGLGAPPNPWETPRERRSSSSSPNPCGSPGSDSAMRRLEEDSEVLKMLQENRELRAAPRQSSTFRLLQEALEDEAGG
ncbi:PDLI2 protein, partial [Amazona guildingii]|nr:PDLI2 protein [Amazona guildingii]